MSNFAMTKDEIDARRRVRASMLINQIEKKQIATIVSKKKSTKVVPINGGGAPNAQLDGMKNALKARQTITGLTADFADKDQEFVKSRISRATMVLQRSSMNASANSLLSNTGSNSSGVGSNVGAESAPASPTSNGFLNAILAFRAQHSLYIFSTTNPFRLVCARIANHSAFEGFIIFCILTSSGFLALESPVHHNDENVQLSIQYADWIFLSCFRWSLLLKLSQRVS